MISDRKLEHLLICENYDVEFKNKTTGFEDIELIHNVLPEIDKNEIDLSTSVFGKKLDSPLFITAITGGHPAAKNINSLNIEWFKICKIQAAKPKIATKLF